MLLNCGLKIVYTKYIFSNLKQNVSGFHKYNNFTLITQRLDNA